MQFSIEGSPEIDNKHHKERGFLWHLSFNKYKGDIEVPLTVNDTLKLMPLIKLINDHREQIEKIITGLIPLCGEFKEIGKLVSSAKWGFSRVETFFNLFAPVDKEEIETEDGLKELKQKIELSNHYGILIVSDGKNRNYMTIIVTNSYSSLKIIIQLKN
jgi:hypothetical protein